MRQVVEVPSKVLDEIPGLDAARQLLGGHWVTVPVELLEGGTLQELSSSRLPHQASFLLIEGRPTAVKGVPPTPHDHRNGVVSLAPLTVPEANPFTIDVPAHLFGSGAGWTDESKVNIGPKSLHGLPAFSNA